MANPVTSMGTVFKKATVAIAHLTSIAGVELTAETIDITALDSANSYKEFILGTKDAGEVKIQGFFNGADHESLYLEFDNGTSASYTIEFPDKNPTTGSKWTFTAFVIGYSTGAEVDNAVSFEATLKITGKPTFAKGA